MNLSAFLPDWQWKKKGVYKKTTDYLKHSVDFLNTAPETLH